MMTMLMVMKIIISGFDEEDIVDNDDHEHGHGDDEEEEEKMSLEENLYRF